MPGATARCHSRELFRGRTSRKRSRTIDQSQGRESTGFSVLCGGVPGGPYGSRPRVISISCAICSRRRYRREHGQSHDQLASASALPGRGRMFGDCRLIENSVPGSPSPAPAAAVSDPHSCSASGVPTGGIDPPCSPSPWGSSTRPTRAVMVALSEACSPGHFDGLDLVQMNIVSGDQRAIPTKLGAALDSVQLDPEMGRHLQPFSRLLGRPWPGHSGRL